MCLAKSLTGQNNLLNILEPAEAANTFAGKTGAGKNNFNC